MNIKSYAVIGTLLWACMGAGGLTGCATIVKGHSQEITLQTTPPGAACNLMRSGKAVGAVNPTPGSVTVEKSKTEIAISCKKDGYFDADGKVASKFHPMTFGNILFGGIIGIGVDAASGAMTEYESSVAITLIPAEFGSADERDAFFDKLREELLAESVKEAEAIKKKCAAEADCQRRRDAVEKSKEGGLAQIEQKRSAAKLRSS
jgi:hypothetical protein